MMDISKELSSAITKRQKNTAELESAISQAQEETDQQIKMLQRQMKDNSDAMRTRAENWIVPLNK